MNICKIKEIASRYNLMEIQALLFTEALSFNLNEEEFRKINHAFDQDSWIYLNKFKEEILLNLEKIDKERYDYLMSSEKELNLYLFRLLPSKLTD